MDAFANLEYDILVGTQMVSKGLDFAHVGLVGVMSADRMLTFPDFRRLSAPTKCSRKSQAAQGGQEKAPEARSSSRPSALTIGCCITWWTMTMKRWCVVN